MTEETARLDYSKPPPGYRIEPVGYGSAGRTKGLLVVAGSLCWDTKGPMTNPATAAGWSLEDDATAAAWVHYKAHNDPPGIATAPDDSLPLFHPLRLRGRCRWTILVTVGGVQFGGEAVAADQPAARVAAWAWHDRRHALVARLEDEGVQVDMWPHALVWTDSECLECERWPGMRAMPDDFPAVLRSLAEMPEVLRG